MSSSGHNQQQQQQQHQQQSHQQQPISQHQPQSQSESVLSDRGLSILDGLRLGESPYLHPFFLHLTSGMDRNHSSWNLPPMDPLPQRDVQSKTKVEDDNIKTAPDQDQPMVQDFQKLL